MARRSAFRRNRSALRLRRQKHGGALARVRRRLVVERLEERLVMDGAGFVHTDPEPDPNSIVGVAGVLAQDDYVQIASSGEVRIDVLSNDPLPEGAESLKIKSVSATARGATVTISEDGQRIIYTIPEGALSFDSFYYIVESDDGKLGKANVTLTRPGSMSGGPVFDPPVRDSDYYTLLEDASETTLDVLRNDGSFGVGEIVAVTAAQIGAVRISDDGKSLLYQPNFGQTGHDRFEYTVRLFDGSTACFRVIVNVEKPYQIHGDGDGNENWGIAGDFARDVGTGPHTFNLLANDWLRGPTPETPRIDEVVVSEHVGELVVSADGQSVTYEPAEGFLGHFTFSYTVRYGPLAHQTVVGSVGVRVQNTFLAVDNWFRVDKNSAGADLDVLANDPALMRNDGVGRPLSDVGLAVTSWSAGSRGGQVVLAPDGQSLRYTPARGFEGDETFTYTVADSNGHADTAQVTVHVAKPVASTGVPKFHVPGELRQYLIDEAVERLKYSFGLTYPHYSGFPHFVLYDALDGDVAVASLANGAGGEVRSHSQTNTQVAGVDEADIVETDGRYLYTFSHGKLVIADLADLENATLVSFFDLADNFTEMYLQGDRITLLDRGSYHGNKYYDGKVTAVVTVLDVSDRSKPTILERTEIDGHIVDSRAIGDRVYVAVNGMQYPQIEYELFDDEQYQVNETLDEYVARLSNTLIEKSLPVFRAYDSAGMLTRSGVLTDPTNIHKPIDSSDNSLLSLVTFDVSDNVVGPLSSTGIFSDSAAEVYMAGDSFYVLRDLGQETAIFKFDVMEDGSSQLVATGKVSGTLLNQFSVDEYEGRLRIATTQTEFETFNGWQRQLRRFNNLFVLEQHGAELVQVGSIVDLAPTETIKSVRFLGERAYVVTFRAIDPLFAIDLSDPTQPEVRGALKIPGYSDYLQPVGEDYVVGIGRDANEITGSLGPTQISLFYVGDLSNPTLVDQVTMEGADWAWTEASYDHHAVAWFEEYQVLTIPVSWTESTEEDPDGDGVLNWRYDRHSAVWAFVIDVDGSGGGAIDITGKVKHEGDARRSVRIEDALVTVSENTIKINQLADPAEEIGELYIGPLPTADMFTVTEDSGPNELDVRANDRAGVGGVVPKIVAVTQPVRQTYYYYHWNQYGNGEPAGTVEIAADGVSLVFTPSENFFGTATFTYTVFDPLRGEQQATVTVQVENVPDDPDAVDDQFEVEPGSAATFLNVLANDANVDDQGISRFPWYITDDIDIDIDVATPRTMEVTNSLVASDAMLADDIAYWNPYWGSSRGLTIKAVGATSHGGTVEIDQWGRGGLKYTPAMGFVGVETFTYTVETAFGRTDTATVTMYVGVEPPAEVELEGLEMESPVALPTLFAAQVERSATTSGSTDGAADAVNQSVSRSFLFSSVSNAIGRPIPGGAALRLERLSLFSDPPIVGRPVSDELSYALAASAAADADFAPVDIMFAEIESVQSDAGLDAELVDELAASVLSDNPFSW